jgi:hypothetical protein
MYDVAYSTAEAQFTQLLSVFRVGLVADWCSADKQLLFIRCIFRISSCDRLDSCSENEPT